MNPNTLTIGDRVTYNKVNKWTAVLSIDEKCKCKRNKRGWVMRDKGEYQLWWDNDEVWKDVEKK
jgi:hypothetical protein